ncbi:MAG: UDP-N-acetylmuramoyl-L-alanyl-D-glutamate--2,6-diaminopimelate ligase [Candidatus Moraniibacteriota bacterium]
MKHFFSRLVPQFIKNVFYHWPFAVVANVAFGFPGKKLRIIGVTGTNGKTTTTEFITRILDEAGYQVAKASTIEYEIGKKKWVNASKYTTPSSWQLQKFLSDALQAGCEWVVLETSSHALHQRRVWGVRYEVAVITNVTREHLDYHRSIDRYRAAKHRLFEGAENAVINLDMERPEEYLQEHFKQTLTFSTKKKEATVFSSEMNLDFTGSEFLALGKLFRLRLPGVFNIENALAAITTAKLLGIDTEVMQKALAKVSGIPGRMELVSNARGLDIIIDYAVTPDAFEKLYTVALPMKIPGTKIIHVFGACGERDRGKRPVMGKMASEKADIVILTNEDPYYEDPERIIDEIEGGIENKKPGENFYRIFDRREAIVKALSLAEEGDILLVTGKGAEETMAFGAKRVPWQERRVIEEELTKLS